MFRRASLLPLVAWIAFAGLLRLTVALPEACPPFDHAIAMESAAAATDWITRSQRPDGTYVYEYDRKAGQASPFYNVVRHAGVTMSLYQAAGRRDDAGALVAGDWALAWMQANLMRNNDWAALVEPGTTRAQLGASALMLVAMAERRLATGDASFDDLMHEVGRFLIAMQRPDGGFLIAWDTGTGEPDRIGTSKYYPGEALWALALTHEAFPNEGWDGPARAAARFLTTRRDEVEDVKFPPLADQWTAYGLAEMAEWGLDDPEIDYARRLAARFGFLVRVEAQRQDGALARLAHGRETRAAGMGTWLEALGSLWRLSNADDRLADLRPDIEERIDCAGGILAARQVRGSDAPDPERGAWFRSDITRMDDQQHALSAIIYANDALEGRVRREPDIGG